MYRNHTVGVIVPAYNEEGRVGDVIETVPDFVDRIYAIDDCSDDGTWAEIRRHATTTSGTIAGNGEVAEEVSVDGGATFDTRVAAIRHDRNRSVGGAIKTGYLRALEDEIDVTAVMAGDGQMDPDILPRFLDPIVEGEADYAKGNRLENKDYREKMPGFRLFGNWILTALTRIASGYWQMMDPQNGYTAISLEALERIDVEELYEYYGYPNDLLVKLNANELRIADVPMTAVYGDEESSISYPTYIRRVSLMLFRNFFWRLRARYLDSAVHPLPFVYIAGILTAAVGVLDGLRTAISRNRSDESVVGRLVSSPALIAIGLLMILFSALIDMKENRDMVV